MTPESDVRIRPSFLLLAGRWSTCVLAALMLTACGGGGTTTYTIGGTITGLSESGLTLDDNGGNTLTVAADATTFTFTTALQSGATYDVTVATQPTGESCTVTSASGTVASASVTSVAIACVESGVTVSTFAGSATAGNTNGTGTGASFDGPAGVALDSSGNLYVAEYYNNDIRKISPAGVVTLFAGSSSGTSGNTNGTGSGATFHNPTGVAVDSAGNVYVADESNNEIRMITPAGVVTTFAGSGTAGNVDGTGTAAEFNGPEGIAIDSSGNLWVADGGNNEIRKITTPGAVVTTWAGNGTAGRANGNGTSATFNMPVGVAVDSSGNLYVADFNNNEIRKIDTTDAVTLFAGSSTGASGSANGTGSAAEFLGPFGIAIDSAGNLYVTDSGNSEIRMLTPSAVVTTYAGSTTAGNVNGSASAAEFHYPFGIVVDASGNLYVCDYINNEIREIIP
jgi:serine/threonine protein kinase, bacterial